MRLAPAASSLALVAVSLAAPAAAATGPCTAGVDVAGAMECADPRTRQCAGPGGGDECRTAAQAAPHMVASFRAYNVSCVQEAACLVSLMLLESAGLRYKHNVKPGVPGQGTANMQSPRFNLLYAKDVDRLDGDAKKAMLALVTPDALNFGSAAWFYRTQCPDHRVKARLRDGGLDGCAAYLAECVGVAGADKARLNLNQKVFKEMGVDWARGCVPMWET